MTRNQGFSTSFNILATTPFPQMTTSIFSVSRIASVVSAGSSFVIQRIDHDTLSTIGIVVASTTVVGLVGIVSGSILIARRISNSVGVAPPTHKQLKEENPTECCPLFRHLPHLSTKLAWRSLLGGTVNPSSNNENDDKKRQDTPVHVCRITRLPKGKNDNDKNNDEVGLFSSTPDNDTTLEFYVKREDLISDLYGGNKVRTLQHQLAVLEARRDRGDTSCHQIVSIGSGGSNQVVATVVHAYQLGWDNNTNKISNNPAAATTTTITKRNTPATAGGNTKHRRVCAVNACWFTRDEPDFDNTLNMLSALSFPNIGFTFDWGMKIGWLRFIRAIIGTITQRDFIPLMAGGNCPTGVIGQASGIIELAEQIVRGESPDIDRIYVPIGSACTVSGLILGVVLVRHLKLDALSSPSFKIVGCNVHEGFAMGDRLLNLHTNPVFGFIPTTITHSVDNACQTLKNLGGPDLETDCRHFIRSNFEIRAGDEVVGKYGTHSEKSREMAQHYDRTGIITDFSTGEPQKELWICGHFVAKAFQPLVHDLEQAIDSLPLMSQDSESESESKSRSRPSPPKYMLWQTKSAVQPKGAVDEWTLMKKQNSAVKEWANKGIAESIRYRPGKVDTDKGQSNDYQSVMTMINVQKRK